MEVKFENKTTITKEILAEFSKKAFKIYNKKYRMFVLLISVLCIILSFTAIAADGFSWFFIFMLLALIFFLFMYFKGYIFKLNQNYKNFNGLYGTLPEFIYRFYDEKIEASASRANLSIDYSQITKFSETENLYILMIEKQGIILKKNGFTIGDFNNFKVFMEEKYKNHCK